MEFGVKMWVGSCVICSVVQLILAIVLCYGELFIKYVSLKVRTLGKCQLHQDGV